MKDHDTRHMMIQRTEYNILVSVDGREGGTESVPMLGAHLFISHYSIEYRVYVQNSKYRIIVDEEY